MNNVNRHEKAHSQWTCFFFFPGKTKQKQKTHKHTHTHTSDRMTASPGEKKAQNIYILSLLLLITACCSAKLSNTRRSNLNDSVSLLIDLLPRNGSSSLKVSPDAHRGGQRGRPLPEPHRGLPGLGEGHHPQVPGQDEQRFPQR